MPAVSPAVPVAPDAFLNEYTSFAVPFIIMTLAFIGMIAIQILATVKFDSIFWFIIPIFLGVAGGFSSLACMSYYSSFDKILENNTPYLTPSQLSDAPNFGAFEIVFIFLAILFFASMFVSFVLAAVKAFRNRNQF